MNTRVDGGVDKRERRKTSALSGSEHRNHPRVADKQVHERTHRQTDRWLGGQPGGYVERQIVWRTKGPGGERAHRLEDNQICRQTSGQSSFRVTAQTHERNGR